MPLYFFAKTFYYKIKRLPLIGRFAESFTRVVRKIIRRKNARLQSKRDMLEQLDLVLQAVCALQKTTADEVQKNKSVFFEEQAALKKELSDYRERLEFVRVEIFNQIHSGGSRESESFQGEILNRKKLDQCMQKGSIRLNIGCGHKADPEYLNVDSRKLPGVDIAAAADRLPFEPGSLEEIYSAHLLEHFTLVQLRTLLPYWRDLLSPGGRFRAIVPDAEAMILAYARDEMNFDDLREVTFGAQDYDGNFHYTMFTADSLRSLLRQSGLCNITVEDSNRINGKCREMEIIAEKSL